MTNNETLGFHILLLKVLINFYNIMDNLKSNLGVIGPLVWILDASVYPAVTTIILPPLNHNFIFFGFGLYGITPAHPLYFLGIILSSF